MKTSNHNLKNSFIKNAALGLLSSLVAFTLAAQPAPGFNQPLRDRVRQPGTSPLQNSAAELTNAPANYLVRVEWTATNSPSGTLEVLTGDGQFQVNSSLPGLAKEGEPTLTTGITLNGTLKVLNAEQGQVQLFLGRSVPYYVGGPGKKPSSIQQRQEGLTVNFFVTFGKAVVVQRDVNGEISVLVKKQAP